MKKALFTLAFTGFMAITASAQYFHRYKALPDADKPLLDDKPLSFYPEHQFRDAEKSLNVPQRMSRLAKDVRYHHHDNMPNLVPEGFHHMRIYPPDESIRYSLLIHPPMKIRFSNSLKDGGK